MANLKLNHIYKVYGNGHKAVNDFSIDIQDKEFIVFVGPSGCGKSTTLRMIAGLEEITTGDLFIGDTLVNDVEPKDRDIAMVFQSYALYPHMTVYDNMAFSLRNRHLPEAEIEQKVMEAAKILDITDYLDRKPKAMSGGQRQRVALGRAIVRQPKVFLLDEPLSNLDAKLRAQMRTEITKLHKKLQTTFIYVTHDQVEAMTMGTRIVVMKLGYVQQIDTPMNLYNKPKNKFVAGFIGTPQMNFFDVTLGRWGTKATITLPDNQSFTVPYEAVCKVHDDYLTSGKKVCLGIRPEHIEISSERKGIAMTINVVEHLGSECIIYGEIGENQEIEIQSKNQIIVKTKESQAYEVGQKIYVQFVPEYIHLFDAETEYTLLNDIPDYTKVNAAVSKDQLAVLDQKVALPAEYMKALKGKEQFTMEISPSAIVPGKDFTMKVAKVEKVDDQYLAYLEYENRYLFALVSKDVKEGSEYTFDLLYDKIRLLADDEVLLEPVGETENLIGVFAKEEKRENGKKVLKFNYRVDDYVVEAPLSNGHKIYTVEGNACYKKEYKYVIDRDNLVVNGDEGGLKCSVLRILDYGNHKYAEVQTASGNKFLVNAVDNMSETVTVSFTGENIEVYQREIDMRIC